MPKKIELKPLAEVGRCYAVYDESSVEIRVSGILGVLKAWLIGEDNLPLGNIAGGKLTKQVNTSPYYGVLVTQSGRQMFYGEWRASQAKTEPPKAPDAPDPYYPLPDYSWEKITAREFPSTDEKVRFTLSNDAFFSAFKKYGYYLFGRSGDRFALAVRHTSEDASPFPCTEGAVSAGDYMYVVIGA